jgi:hypothetical protein
MTHNRRQHVKIVNVETTHLQISQYLSTEKCAHFLPRFQYLPPLEVTNGREETVARSVASSKIVDSKGL